MTEKKIDPRVIRTKKLIKSAFVELMQEMDINKITVNKIAEKATINRVTFYLHYKDIPDLLEKMAEEMLENIQQIIGKKNIDGERSYSVLEELLEYFAKNAKFYKIVLGYRKAPIFTEQLLFVLRDLVRQRTLHRQINRTEDVQNDILIWYSSSAFIGTISLWLREDMPYSPKYLANQLSLLFQRN